MNKIKILFITLLCSLCVTSCTQEDALQAIEYGLQLYEAVQSQELEEAEVVDSYNIEEVEEWNGEPYIEVNHNIPYFTDDEKTIDFPYEHYEELDELGRCQYAMACVCKETMPVFERESISSVYPTGWENNKYDFIDGGWLYNRCHLIGYQLTAENANWENLITGTRYMNIRGMLPYENWVASYVKETGNHVLYRVTPIFEGDNLLASGVLMEGYSIEDNGAEICFCIYCYNVQPGVEIDYATGENKENLYD